MKNYNNNNKHLLFSLFVACKYYMNLNQHGYENFLQNSRKWFFDCGKLILNCPLHFDSILEEFGKFQHPFTFEAVHNILIKAVDMFYNFKLSKALKYVQLQLRVKSQYANQDVSVWEGGQLVVFVKIRHPTVVSLTGGPELS
ncbi:hypothetical protein T01_2019 [Trichinella spiralis]|uniref:Uncharacterized protein n=1 Tax=Trichinella spiralis TaxID=6334 RepID=A0A0V1BZ89_TRISP|nr:hypothetical protein T01_2019 [Trichinella spiralis]